MKTSHVLIVFFIGCVLYLFGAMQKILHSPNADKFMLFGKLVAAVSVVVFIFLQFFNKKSK